MSLEKFDDVTCEYDYYVEVYNYTNCKTYRFKDSFCSYDFAAEFIKNYDFQSDFGKNPIGIQIVQLPHVSLNVDSFNTFDLQVK